MLSSELLCSTPVKFVVDFDNMQRAGLSSDGLLDLVPLSGWHISINVTCLACGSSITSRFRTKPTGIEFFPRLSFSGNLKTVTDPKRIQELFHEYQSTH